MTIGDSINAHINKVMSIENLLKDLSQLIFKDMLITKIVCTLPLSYNNIITAWTSVPALEQTVADMKVRLLQMKNLMALQGGWSSLSDLAFVTCSSKTSLKNKNQSHEHNKDYIKELKSFW